MTENEGKRKSGPPKPTPFIQGNPLRRTILAIAHWLWKNLRLSGTISFSLGILWIFLFPAVCITSGDLHVRGIYMSESGLIPGRAFISYSHTEGAWASRLQQQYNDLHWLSATGGGCAETNSCHRSVSWLKRKFGDLGFEVFEHRYRLPKNGSIATNVYGVLRGGRASGKEMVVLAARYDNVGPPARAGDHPSGMAMGLSVMQDLKDAKWLSKDVVLLLTVGDPTNKRIGLGVEAWLNSYDAVHDPMNPHMMHFGRIRGALCLEMAGNTIYQSLTVPLPGTNGALPNLDIYNAAARLWASLGMMHSPLSPGPGAHGDVFAKMSKSVLSLGGIPLESNDQGWKQDNSPVQLYTQRLFNMFRFIGAQINGPQASHSHFVAKSIDSLSFIPDESRDPHQNFGVGRFRPQPDRPGFAVVTFGQLLEHLIRCYSNIEEKLHQSFFFYFMPSPEEFVSIDEYLWCLLLIGLPAVLTALKSFMYTQSIDIVYGLKLLIVSVAMGGLTLLLLGRMADDTLGWVTYCAFAEIVAVLVLAVVERSLAPPQTQTKAKTKAKANSDTQSLAHAAAWKDLQFVLLAAYFFSHIGISIFNFSLCIVCALFLSPFAYLARPIKNVALRIFVTLVALAFSPFVVLSIWCTRSPNALRQLMHAHVHWLGVGAMQLPFLCLVVFPLHLLCVRLLWHSSVTGHTTSKSAPNKPKQKTD